MEEQYLAWRRKMLDQHPDQTSLTFSDFRTHTMQGDDNGRLLNYVNANIIFQAGVDFESKPMLVFCACSLPSPNEVDYERLLNLVLFRLDEFVESDYTVVMLSSGAKHQVGWQWMGKAYRRLDRRYRKNIKSVYVVHPSMWTKLVFRILGTFVSQKFFAKITWIDTLAELGRHVPLGQISVPQAVYEYDARVEKGATRAVVEQPILHTREFGVLLVMPPQGLPRPVRETLAFVRHNGLRTEGLFRRSPPSTALRAAKDAYDHSQYVDLEIAGVNVAAVLLKLFVRELPNPVFGTNGCSYDVVRAMPSDGRVDYVRDTILEQISDDYRRLLCFVCALLSQVARSSETRMTAYNLAVVWAPNMLRSNDPVADINMCPAGKASTVGAVVQIMVEHFEQVFTREIASVLGPAEPSDAVNDILNTVDLMNQAS
ncbi:hypothetical protein LPJ54_001094 [Coemansia sp. RSA 1824]|nr:hypothetical protein LPJ54_001094 [Coemansia sp. RSA 1824]KAJ2269731.1 hypothetical protein J3F81_004196 [Coemansia sp. RSA 371]